MCCGQPGRADKKSSLAHCLDGMLMSALCEGLCCVSQNKLTNLPWGVGMELMHSRLQLIEGWFDEKRHWISGCGNDWRRDCPCCLFVTTAL